MRKLNRSCGRGTEKGSFWKTEFLRAEVPPFSVKKSLSFMRRLRLRLVEFFAVHVAKFNLPDYAYAVSA